MTECSFSHGIVFQDSIKVLFCSLISLIQSGTFVVHAYSNMIMKSTTHVIEPTPSIFAVAIEYSTLSKI